MRRVVAHAIAALVIACTAACSNSTATARTASGITPTWIYADNTSVIFISLTRTGNTLTGTEDSAGINDGSATQVSPMHLSLTGTIDGTAITLTILGNILSGSTTISGTLDGATMSLRYPWPGGSIQTLTFHPGTAADYNHDVAALQGQAQSNASASASASASRASASEASASQAADAAARDKAEQQISTDADAFATAVEAANSAMAKSYNFSGFDSDLAEAQKNFKEGQDYVAKAATESESYAACDDATYAQNDATYVENDLNYIGNEQTYLATAVGQLSDTVANVSSALKRYQQDSAAVPGFTVASPPTDGAAKGVTDKVSQVTAGWNSKAADYKSQVQKLLDQANSIATQATKTYCG
ncbi:hypothetical protein ABH935_010049 [Catenulispora sp. GAS73]|uniref:hypothetical protein n=1 Tax=Catenulispora sp. GAS73 TaxID=3156269 RepID=UPI0035145015